MDTAKENNQEATARSRTLSFLGLLAIVFGLPLTILLARQEQIVDQQAAIKNCILPPPCMYREHPCKVPVPTQGWCSITGTPTPPAGCYTKTICRGEPCPKIGSCNSCQTFIVCPTPTLSGCYYQKPAVCPRVCVQGGPCPVPCKPILICPSTTPSIFPTAANAVSIPQGSYGDK